MLPKKLIQARWLPPVLALYLAVMACIGYPDWAAGRTTSLYYWGIIGVTALCIVALALLQRRGR